MIVEVGRGKKARMAYGFDDIAIVPSELTIDPEDVDVSYSIGELEFSIPIIASAMDGVVDVEFAVAMGKLGGLAVLNLHGVQTRYDKADEVIDRIVHAPKEEVTALMQKVYREPIKKELIARRIKQIKEQGVPAAVSSTPADAREFLSIAEDAGVDIFVVQSTVTSKRHLSTHTKTLDLERFCGGTRIPIVIGNCVTYEVAVELMESGASAVLVGIGPGAACTTRGVLGVGVPQVTATSDVAAARDDFNAKSGRYVPVITDGGMATGGDIAKAFASGCDAVMIGSMFAKTDEAPGCGYHWGMATPHAALPRGTRIKVGVAGTLQEILMGPARNDDGTQNIVGALKTAMGTCGFKDIKEFHKCDIVIAPSIQTEGKLSQRTQGVGMGSKS